MTTPLHAEAVFQTLKASMDLTWVAGEGASRQIIPLIPGSKHQLADFLNLIDPPNIQVLGAREMDFLSSLETTVCSSLIKHLLSAPPIAVLLCGRNPHGIDTLFRQSAEDADVPLWHTTAPANTALEELRAFGRRTLQGSTVLHGVLLEIFDLGVLLTGKSGSGKSELALDLVSRGHRLIADDTPEIFHSSPEVLEGTCPENLRDFLEVRGLGILNIRRMFGERAVGTCKQVHLLISLTYLEHAPSAETRLHGSRGRREILNVTIPEIRLPICTGRNPAVLVECAVRDHILRLRGYHADRDLEERLQADLTGTNKYANDHC